MNRSSMLGSETTALPKLSDDYATVAQLADNLDVAEITIWEWIREGNITRYKRPRDRRTYVKRSDVARWRNQLSPRGIAATEGAKFGRKVRRDTDANVEEMARKLKRTRK